jgi:dolichyl-phosphate beta-glucosyltransferase
MAYYASLMNLSVIIPAFNEAQSLAATIADVQRYLRASSEFKTWEIIVVDDGSTDGTAAAAVGEGVQLLQLDRNYGKGAALVAGAKKASGQWVLLMDADNSTSINELDRLGPFVANADIVFGSRAMSGAEITAHQPWYRELAGKLGNLAIRLLVLPDVADSQCGFKLVGPAALPILRAVRTQRWGFDVELLAMARAQHLRLQEVPITWRHDPTSAVGLGSYVGTLWDVVKVAWRLRRSRQLSAVSQQLKSDS